MRDFLSATDRLIEETRKRERLFDRMFPSALTELNRIQNITSSLYQDSLVSEAIKQSSAADELSRIAASGFPDELSRIAASSASDDLVRLTALRNTEIEGFNSILKSSAVDLSVAAEMANSIREAMAFSYPGHQIQEFLRHVQINIDDFDFPELNDDSEQDGDEEREILLPEDFRQEIISVQAIPSRLLHLLRSRTEEYLPQLYGKEGWKVFENFIADTVERLGGRDVVLTRNSRKGDYGIDVIGTFLVDGIWTVFGFQCKANRPGRPVEAEKARSLGGALSRPPHYASRGILCTTSSFQPQAKEYFLQRVEVKGWEPRDIARVIHEKSLSACGP